MREVEDIKPYDPEGAPKEVQVEDMFDSIAPTYDMLNRTMTLGIDRGWRRKAVETLRYLPAEARILDVAAGTADLSIAIAERYPRVTVTGVDLSKKMTDIGRAKALRAGVGPRIDLRIADCLRMPFADGTFHGVTSAFGVRNFADISAGYREMCRVMRPGGTLMVLEMAHPQGLLTKPLFRLYTGYVIPLVGRMLSRDGNAYTYLPESVAAVPARREMCDIIEDAGFVNATFKSLTFGSCIIYTAKKPDTNGK